MDTPTLNVEAISAALRAIAQSAGVPGIRISISNSDYHPVFAMVCHKERMIDAIAHTVEDAVADIKNQIGAL